MAGAAVALAGLGVCSAIARRGPPLPWERRVFSRVNQLPPRLGPALIVVMQVGALGAVPVAAGGAWLTGRRRLARDLAIAGTSAWLLTKVVKRSVGRARPAEFIPDTIDRGHADRGLGFPSGHAAVSTALVVACAPALPPVAAVAAGTLVVATATGRLFVGAHLPLDIVGGAFLGAAIGLLVRTLPAAGRRRWLLPRVHRRHGRAHALRGS